MKFINLVSIILLSIMSLSSNVHSSEQKNNIKIRPLKTTPFGKYNFDITQCRLHGNVAFYLMDELRSIDVDVEEDIKFANYISNICE